MTKDCKGCANWGRLKTVKGIYRWCDKGIINYGKRKCSEEDRKKMTLEDMDYIDRRLKREYIKDLREKGLVSWKEK